MENNNELYHYGVLGMKWGRKKAGYVTYRQGMKKAKTAGDKAFKESMARDRQTLKGFGSARKAVNNANAARKQAMKDSIANDKSYNKNLREKEKRAKENIKRANVKAYSKAMDKATEMSEKADLEWAKTDELRLKMGKNAVSRVIASIRNKTPEAKAYNKQYDKASDLDDRAYMQENRAKELYLKTGKNAVSRIINNIKYSR